MEKSSKRKTKNRRIFLISILIFVLVIVLSWFMLDRWAKKHGFTGAGDFIKTVTVNYWSSFDAEYQTIEITISENDYAKLEEQREKHLLRGIITKTDDRYVPAIITSDGKKIKCKLRLKGHMTDHLQDEKWSFRIKTAGGDAFNGMKIFSLMHPGTRNYIYEWIYHQLLTEEGIATVRYSFLNLKVNGSNWGIYAVEENFASELIGNHKLPKGPILGFNPDLYWYARLNEHDRKNVDISDMSSISTSPEAYDEEENFKSKESKSDYVEAILKMEKFKRGELSTGEVFDLDKLARFHAILDLVGGQFSLDWSDVKYYYNPITQKLEPVGYESFSVRNTNQLSGASKFKNGHIKSAEWHERLFSDPQFFEKYVSHLKRISKKKYLDSFFDEYDSELKNNLAILYAEFPYKKLPLTQYYTNQQNISALLNTPITTMVYLDKVKGDTLYLTAGNSSVLPVEISGLEIDGKKMSLSNKVYFSSRARLEHVFFETIAIKLNDSVSKKDLDKIKLSAHYPGVTKITKIEVKPIDLNEELKYDDFINVAPNFEKCEFLNINEESKEISFKNGEYVLKQDLIIPEGYSVSVSGNFKLSLENNSAIVSNSPIKMKGSEDYPIEITSADSTGKGIILINCKGMSSLNWVNFINVNIHSKEKDTYKANLTLYQSSISVTNCIFTSVAKKAMDVYKSKLTMSHSQFFNFTDKAVELFYAELKLNGVDFLNCKTAIELNGSSGSMDKMNIRKSTTGVRMDNGSSSKSVNWSIEDSEIGIYLTDLSDLKIDHLKLKNIEVGLKAEKKSDVFGPAKIKVTDLKKIKVKSLSETDNKSKVEIK